MTTLKDAIKQAKEQDLTSIKLNAPKERMKDELMRICLANATKADSSIIKNRPHGIMAVNRWNPEWGAKQLSFGDGYYHYGRGVNSIIVDNYELDCYLDVSELPFGLNWAQLF
jgi:hypothetical protein